jgi:hypothetical protein
MRESAAAETDRLPSTPMRSTCRVWYRASHCFDAVQDVCAEHNRPHGIPPRRGTHPHGAGAPTGMTYIAVQEHLAGFEMYTKVTRRAQFLTEMDRACYSGSCVR